MRNENTVDRAAANISYVHGVLFVAEYWFQEWPHKAQKAHKVRTVHE